MQQKKEKRELAICIENKSMQDHEIEIFNAYQNRGRSRDQPEGVMIKSLADHFTYEEILAISECDPARMDTIIVHHRPLPYYKVNKFWFIEYKRWHRDIPLPIIPILLSKRSVMGGLSTRQYYCGNGDNVHFNEIIDGLVGIKIRVPAMSEIYVTVNVKQTVSDLKREKL